jgi:cyclin-dependent kinase 2
MHIAFASIFSRSWMQLPKSFSDTHLGESNETYELRRYIDQGRYSMVFDATDTQSEKPVVIKVLKSGRLDKIAKEIELLTILKDSPGVIRLLNSSSNHTRFNYLVFESIGDDIQALSHIIPLSEQDVKTYFRLLLQALMSCHEHKIMHRDIKPRNIIVNRASETLRLLDFGLR